MSSEAIEIQQSESKFSSSFGFTFKTVGVVLVGLSLFGFVYAFYPARRNVVEIDLGSKLQTLSPPERVDNANFQDDGQASFVKASWGQQPGVAQLRCAISGVPSSVPEGRSSHQLSYTCNNRPVSHERLSPQWTTNSGRIDVSNPSVLVLDTTGLGGKRMTVSATYKGCGVNVCEKKWTISVAQQNRRLAVIVMDDAGNGVPGAIVTLSQITRRRTDGKGVAQFTDLKPGTYSISVVADGFNEFNTTRELTSDNVVVRAPLVRTPPPVTPSPTAPASPTPSTPTPTPTPTPSPTPSASAELTPSATPVPSATVPISEQVFAPERNGNLSVSWPTTVSAGWSNVCRITYVPPAGWAGHNVQAAFYLRSTTGLAGANLRSGFQPIDQNSHEWDIPLEPVGADGSLARAELVMSVRIGSEGSVREIPLQPLQSRIEDKPLTKNETLGGSTLSGVLGFGFLGAGRIKRKKPTEESVTYQVDTPPEPAESRPPEPAESQPPDPAESQPPDPAESQPPDPAESRPPEPAESQPPDPAESQPPDPAESQPPDPPESQPPEPESPKPPPSPQPPRTHGGGLETVTVPAEEPRYTDVTIYEDHLFEPEDLEGAVKVPDDVPLIANEPYTLEVAIRLKRTGIRSNLPARRGVDNPRKDEETLTIHVLATPVRGIKIKERLATISWPFNSDSQSALFHLEIDEPDTTRPGIIEIRILDHSLNLLDIVMLEVAIVVEQGEKVDPAVPLRDLTWPDKGREDREGLGLAGSSEARLASIHVRQVTGGFTFEFVMLSANGEAVDISIFRDISTDDLTFLLARVRDFWSKLVISNYARKLAVSPSTYDAYLRELRDLGIQTWSLLFDTRTFAKEGASERLGQILARVEADEKALKEAQPLFDSGEGDRIQISYASDYGDFIFPWSILHPPVPKDTPVDPLRFWGARYQIEQVTKGPKRDRIDDRPIKILFALDSTFGDAPSQKKMFEDYQAEAKGELVVSSPISDRKTLEESLISDPSAHLLYFYCHGYAATRPGLLMADGVKSLKALIESIREKSTEGDSPTATALEKLMELTSKMAGESWIYLGDAEVKEAELRLLRFFARRRPIVFLNMCQSADLVPSMSSGLVHLFLDHNASAVVGTESPMTGVFADAFARIVLERLFKGDNIGTALWKARRHFLTKGRNPLGLAYTLYGRADATLGTKDRPFVIPGT